MPNFPNNNYPKIIETALPYLSTYYYHLKDHLGNVRVTFSTTHEFYEMKEDFEGGDNGFTDLHLHTDANANTTTPLASSDGVGLLQSGDTGGMIFLGMNKGDTVDLSVKANYETAPTGNSFLGTAYSALFSSFDGSFGSGVENGVSSTSSVFDDALSGVDMAGKGSSSTAPRAFLNYIFFDREMNYVTAGFEQISTAALRTAPHDYGPIAINDIIADREGYILAYLSNENSQPVNVHFDDFTVYHGKTNVVSSQDYYPFGMAMQSFTRTASTPQNFLLTSNEKLPEWGVGMYDFNARMYDASIGRFGAIDPLADMNQESWTPYHFNFDNPLRYVDPTGLYSTEEWMEDNGITDDDLITVYSASDSGGGDDEEQQQDPIDNILKENGSGLTRDEMLLPSLGEELLNSTVNVTKFLLSPSGKANSVKYIKTLMLVDDITSAIDVLKGVEEYVDTRILNRYSSSSVNKLERYSKVLAGIENNYSEQINSLEDRLNNFPKIQHSDIASLKLKTQTQITNTQRKLDVVVKEYITINALIYAKKMGTEKK